MRIRLSAIRAGLFSILRVSSAGSYTKCRFFAPVDWCLFRARVASVASRRKPRENFAYSVPVGFASCMNVVHRQTILPFAQCIEGVCVCVFFLFSSDFICLPG